MQRNLEFWFIATSGDRLKNHFALGKRLEKRPAERCIDSEIYGW
jgi:hypothetical protein